MESIWISTYGFINSVLSFVTETTKTFWNENLLFFVLAVVCFVILMINRKSLRRGRLIFVSFSVIVLILTVYNPLLLDIIQKLPDSNGISSRLWITVPIWMIIAYSLTDSIARIKNKVIQSCITSIIVFVLIVFGSTVITNNTMIDSQNKNKVRNESIELAEEVLALSDGQPTRLAIFPRYEDSDSNYKVGGTVVSGLLQYTGYIDIEGRYLLDDEWNNYMLPEQSPDGIWTPHSYIEYILYYYKHCGLYDYLAMPDDDSLIPTMEGLGYRVVGHAGGFYIYVENNR